MLLDALTPREVAILQATKASDNAQTATQLAANAEAPLAQAQDTIALLTARNILTRLEQWDYSIAYGFGDNDYAQAIYDELYGPLETDPRYQ
jgi:hypothetical protein